jgi:hypothetical protein
MPHLVYKRKRAILYRREPYYGCRVLDERRFLQGEQAEGLVSTGDPGRWRTLSTLRARACADSDDVNNRFRADVNNF